MRWIMLVVCLMLAGCGSMNPMTITDNMVDEAGNVISTTVTSIADVDAIRSKNFADMRINRDKVQGKAYDKSGFKMEFTTVEVAPGYKAYLPKTVEYKPELRFQDPMPVQEMVNPVYAAVTSLGNKLMDTILGVSGIWALSDAYKNSVEAAQPRYGGDYNYQSLNQTAEPFIVNPVIVQ